MSPNLTKLIDRWAARHTAFERYAIGWRTSFGLVSWLGLDRFSTAGRVVRALYFLTVLLGIPVALSTLTLALGYASLGAAPVGVWAAIAVAYSCASFTYPLYKDAAEDVVGLYRRMRDPEAMRDQIAWDRRWFRLPAIMPVGGAFALTVIAAVVLTSRQLASTVTNPIPLGTLFIIAILAYQLGENTYIALGMCVEAHRLSRCPHALAHLSPADTPAVGRTVRAYGRLGMLDSLFMTVFLTSLAALLPDPAYLTSPAMLTVLAIVYLAVAAEVVVPRLAVERVIRKHKARDLARLQQRIDARVTPLLAAPASGPSAPAAPDAALADDALSRTLALQQLHDRIRDAPDTAQPAGAVRRIASTLLLPLLTFVLSAVGETYVSVLIEPFLR